MKTLLLILTLACTTAFAETPAQSDAPPSLSLAKAAALAEAKLAELKLPPEYFLKSITWYPSTAGDSGASYYVASYTPKITADVIFVTEHVGKFLKIDLDGTVTVTDQVPRSPRRIITRPKTDSATPALAPTPNSETPAEVKKDP